MNEKQAVLNVIISFEFLSVLMFGAVSGLARGAIDKEGDYKLILNRVYLGSFWAMLVFVSYRLSELDENISNFPEWMVFIVIIIGAMYSNEAIAFVKEKVVDRIKK